MSPPTSQEQSYLLELARRAIANTLAGSPLNPEALAPAVSSQVLQDPGTAFVTLRLEGNLRGCVGVIRPKPLYQAVAEAAVLAAFQDPRFSPVTSEELPHLEVEISVLSPFFSLCADEVVPGEHGLLVSDGVRRGLLLPQVAREMGWTRERFLEEACLKAGLAPTAWRGETRLEAFTALVFSDAVASHKPRP